MRPMREPRWQAAWRTLLCADAQIDFGIYRALNANQPEIDTFLATYVGEVIGRALEPDERAFVYERFRELAKRVESLADSPDFYVRPTAPLPEYAFRTATGCRVE